MVVANPERWAVHCHNVYHMELGMMTLDRLRGLIHSRRLDVSNPLPRLRVTAIAGLAAVFLLSACAIDPSPHADDTAVRVAPATFADVIAEPATFVLNVHTPDEGSLPGTEANIPFDQLHMRADELPADRSTPIAVYCRTGSMSTLATVTLGDLGYTDVTELEGGMEAWRNDGRALTPPQPDGPGAGIA